MENWPFNPIIFQIGPFQAHWYGLMYALAFIFGYLYLLYSKPGKSLPLSLKQKDSLAIFTILGVLLGGRIGYILFYNLPFYLENPLNIFAVWQGGMSIHGGVLGVSLSLFIFAKIHKIKLLVLGDFITQVVPIGIMFVRIGNFINAELYGRIANSFCIHFPTDPANCRYPSQLLQSFLEGLVLFLVIFFVARKTNKTGLVSALFLMLYGLFRIITELFREPDPQIGFLAGQLTMGQLLSILMIIAGISITIYSKVNFWHNIEKNKNKKHVQSVTNSKKT